MNKISLFLCSILFAGSAVQAKSLVFQSDIFYEISHGNTKAVKALVTFKSNLSVKNEQGQSLLHAAVLTGNRKMVKILVKAGVAINELNLQGKTALDLAVEQGYVKITYDLIKKKALIACATNEKPLKNLIVKRMTRLYKIFGGILAFGVALVVVGLILANTIFTGLEALGIAVITIIPGMVIGAIGLFEIAGLGITSAVRTRTSYLLN